MKHLKFDEMKAYYPMDEVCDLFDMDLETIYMKMEEAKLKTVESPDGTTCISKDTLCRLNKKVYWDDRPEELKVPHYIADGPFGANGASHILIDNGLCFGYYSLFCDRSIYYEPME